MHYVEYEKTLQFAIKTSNNVSFDTFISYSTIIITHVCCMSIRIFSLKKCLRKCLRKTIESIENIDILKTGNNIDKGIFTSVDNFFVKNFLCNY